MFIIAIKVLFARMLDVTIGTVRTMYVVKGNKIVSSILAFLEVLIWYYASRSIFNNNDDSIIILICYALGFSFGTIIGSFINDIFIGGIYSIQVISMKITKKDIRFIKSCGFGLTVLESTDGKKVLLIEINKKRYKECIKLLKSIDNNCFIVVNDSKVAYNGYLKSR